MSAPIVETAVSATTSTSTATVRGRGLRTLRTLTGTRAVDLAAAAGVPPAAIYNWEAGRARVPRDLLEPLARTLGLPPTELERLLAGLPAAAPAAPRPLRRLRHRAGLSQAEVARRVGAGRHTVGGWERGTRPPLAALRRLARVYGVPVAVVARAAGVPPPPLLDPARWRAGDLPEVLRVLRCWGGLTQRELAARRQVSEAAARGWEAGRWVPRAATVALLEQLHGLPPGALARLTGLGRGPG